MLTVACKCVKQSNSAVKLKLDRNRDQRLEVHIKSALWHFRANKQLFPNEIVFRFRKGFGSPRKPGVLYSPWCGGFVVTVTCIGYYKKHILSFHFASGEGIRTTGPQMTPGRKWSQYRKWSQDRKWFLQMVSQKIEDGVNSMNTLFFFNKNKLNKNIEAEIARKIRTI